MPRTNIQFRAAESFANDVEEHAEERGLSKSEYIREATRRQMQRDVLKESEHRLAGAEPRTQPDDAGDIEDTL